MRHSLNTLFSDAKVHVSLSALHFSEMFNSVCSCDGVGNKAAYLCISS